MPTAWTMPTSTPPRKAPGRLVIPPSTAAVNAGIRYPDVITPGVKLPVSGTATTAGEGTEEGGEDPHERREPTHADADELGRRRFLAGAEDGEAEVGLA